MSESQLTDLPPRDEGAPLLTIDDIAARWGVAVSRVYKRLRGNVSIRAVNLGTDKHPILRFRRESIEAWEQQVEQPASVWVGKTEPLPSGGQTKAAVTKLIREKTPDDLLQFRPRNRKATTS